MLEFCYRKIKAKLHYHFQYIRSHDPQEMKIKQYKVYNTRCFRPVID